MHQLVDQVQESSRSYLATINYSMLKHASNKFCNFSSVLLIFSMLDGGWVTDLVSSLWLARTHTLLHKAFLSGTKSVYCGQGGHSFQTHWGGFNPSHSSDWMASPSLIKSYLICQDQGVFFIGLKKSGFVCSVKEKSF